MKNIQALEKQIKNLQTELDRADAAKARCVAAIEAAEVRKAELSDLHEQRTAIVAQAFADGEKADTTAIDAEIVEYQKKHELEVKDGEAASRALELLETRCTEYRDALTTARDEIKTIALADLAARREKVKEAFARAVDALREPMEDYLAIDAAQYRLDDAIPRGNFAYMPGRMLMVALQSEGLRVWTERGLQGPDWFADLRKPGANEKTTALFEELRGLGLEV